MRGNQVNFIVTQTKSSRPPLFQEDPLPRVPPPSPGRRIITGLLVTISTRNVKDGASFFSEIEKLQMLF